MTNPQPFKLSTIKPGIRAVVLPDGTTPYLVLSYWKDTSGTWYTVVDFDEEIIDNADPDFDWSARSFRHWDTSQYSTIDIHYSTLAGHADSFDTLTDARQAIASAL
ncbi:MAG: hypothetical protein QF464_01155 [Myxococcota bacterium]|jgi:hypothetical protein|nr:hypothetical protein [Myxococcota bacterium]